MRLEFYGIKWLIRWWIQTIRDHHICLDRRYWNKQRVTQKKKRKIDEKFTIFFFSHFFFFIYVDVDSVICICLRVSIAIIVHKALLPLIASVTPFGINEKQRFLFFLSKTLKEKEPENNLLPQSGLHYCRSLSSVKIVLFFFFAFEIFDSFIASVSVVLKLMEQI